MSNARHRIGTFMVAGAEKDSEGEQSHNITRLEQ